ncbi:MAG: ATP-binding protein [Pirellulales bacterium]
MNLPLPANLYLANLSPTDSAIAARLEDRIREAVTPRRLIATNNLELEEYAQLGLCQLKLSDAPPSVAIWEWGGEDHDSLVTHFEQAAWHVRWRDLDLYVVKASWDSNCGGTSRFWIAADELETAESFLLDVKRKTNDPGESILVFHGGYWQRSRELYAATQQASFDDLVLSGTLKDSLRDDFHRFLAARERYESLGVAWRRGALLIGPPGNGKTHCVRALVKELKIPSLYVQSLASRHYTSEEMLRVVFDRARQLRPCMLIFEDLDALVNEENRSFFLNQLDGFEKNVGMIVLATTNHPERIDPAILDRPSRFDRKYHFGLPAAVERQAYLEMWHVRLVEETNWDAATIRELTTATEGFSFAYLKELVVSSLLRWMADHSSGFALTLLTQAAELRGQMTTSSTIASGATSGLGTLAGDVSGD